VRRRGCRESTAFSGVAAAALLACVVAAAAPATPAPAQQLPKLEPSFEPQKLKPGVWRTGDGFAPTTTFRVSAGWYGVQGSPTDWLIGKRLDRVEQEFKSGGIFVDVLRFSFAKAVARFKALRTLSAWRPTTVRVDGYRGVTFNAKVKGDHAPLTAIGTGADIPGGKQGRRTFLNVRGKTLLIRLEWATAGEANDIRRVFRSFCFRR
jgi:hypothetical protein